MLNETASSRDTRPVVSAVEPEPAPGEHLQDQLQQMVAEVMEIDEVTFEEGEQEALPLMMRAFGSQTAARFVGRLRMDSEAAYDRLDAGFQTLRHTPIFREERGRHVILALKGRIEPQPRSWWPNLILFILTVFSVLLVGTELALPSLNRIPPDRLLGYLVSNLWRGLPYALSILLILGAHELGHYFAARRHGLAVTLPYFIPLPFLSPFGTMGAFIQLRQPMRNRKVLLDVGAAGPLAGLVFAVPLLFIGLASAQTGTLPPNTFYSQEGDSLLYAFAKLLTFGQVLPSNGVDVFIDSSQLAWAGWTGLLVSALNLIPIGQLDGGHIMYALLGERARVLYYPLILVMFGLVFVTQVWLLWVLLLLVFGRVYATPLDMITPLDRPRRWLGVLAMVVFLLIFVPAPLTSGRTPPAAPRGSAQVEPAGIAAQLFTGR
jgi:membrane-associated protease RseP (regulator of RpoE activity)